MSQPSYEPLEYETVFAADVMFYQSAKAALAKAGSAIRAIERAERRLTRHMGQLATARDEAEDYDDRGNRKKGAYDRFESLAISAENYEYEVTEAHGPLLQHLALVHILSAISLEAHINIRAETLLESRFLSAFERLNVDAKWLFLPRVLGLRGFEPGAEPFQGFERLVSARNRLVHYKPHKETYRGLDNPEGFARKLDLSLESAERSLAVLQGMVTEFADQLGEDSPWWFRSDSPHFFQTSVKDKKKRSSRKVATETRSR
jgi:hypothetical protein